MPLDPRQERYLERFFPGLVEDLRKLGPGDFTAQLPSLAPKGNGIGKARLHATYEMDDQTCVIINVTCKLKAGRPAYVAGSDADLTPVNLGDWEYLFYSFSYGGMLKDSIFRFDLDESSGHHVHIQPDTKEHLPSAQVEPIVTNIMPRKFVEMVAAFRERGVYPVRRKQR